MDGIFLSACVPIYSRAIFRPMGPYQLAWYLRQHNYNIQVIDFIQYFTEEETLVLIERFMTPQTKVVGIGFMIGLENPDMGALIKKFESVLFKVKKKRENLYLFCKTYSMYCPISKSGNKDST